LSPPSRLHSIAREGEPRASARGRYFEYAHRLALLVNHISNRRLNCTPSPKVARAAMARPAPAIWCVQLAVIQCTAAVSFHRDQHAFRFAVSRNYNVKYDSCARARLGVSSRGGRKPPEDSSSTTCLRTESSRYGWRIIRLLDRCSLLESGAGRRAPHRFCVRGMLPL
jgi:hypothetical protein